MSFFTWCPIMSYINNFTNNYFSVAFFLFTFHFYAWLLFYCCSSWLFSNIDCNAPIGLWWSHTAFTGSSIKYKCTCILTYLYVSYAQIPKSRRFCNNMQSVSKASFHTKINSYFQVTRSLYPKDSSILSPIPVKSLLVCTAECLLIMDGNLWSNVLLYNVI